MRNSLFKSLHIWTEVFLRIFLFIAFIKLETTEPFQRKILPDEIWIYRWVTHHKMCIYLWNFHLFSSSRYPVKPSLVPVTVLWPLVTFIPIFIFIIVSVLTRHASDLKSALLGHTLSFCFNGVVVGETKWS
jgi:hypothetical protein